MAEIIIKSDSHDFLASEVGLRQITYTFAKTNSNVVEQVTEKGVRKIIPAGTIYPSNDASAKGIVFNDVDVTEGNKSESLMVGGVVLSTKTLVAGVPTVPATTAIEALAKQGLFVQVPGTVSLQNED